MQKLSKKQLELLKNEQLRQLYDEREVLKQQSEEGKRLEWLNKKANHSLGQKNRHEAMKDKRRPRSQKRNFVKNGEYQDWTYSFSRMTVLWDQRHGQKIP